jgi:hypothetical protein
MDSINTLTRSVSDIIVESGYQCKFYGCTYAVKDQRTAQKHIQDHEADPDIYLSQVKVQKIFNSNLHKYCVIEAGNTEFDMETEMGRMLAAFRQQANELLPKAAPIGIFSLSRCLILASAQGDLRLSNVFIAWSRWDLLVDGIEWVTLRNMAAMPTMKDPFHHITDECRAYIKADMRPPNTNQIYVQIATVIIVQTPTINTVQNCKGRVDGVADAKSRWWADPLIGCDCCDHCDRHPLPGP